MTHRLPVSERSRRLPAEQVRQLTTDLLAEHLPLGVSGYRYRDADIFNVVVAAAAQGRSLASVGQQLVAAPSANLVRQYVTERLCDQEFEALEARLNALLVARLPRAVLTRPQRLAIDLTLLPYYGREGLEPDQLRRGEAKAGTTRFHCYATASVLHTGRRVTLVATFVHADEALLDVLVDLLGRLDRLGVRIQRLLLDREFASVAILQTLAAQPFPSIAALPKRGARLKALLTGRASYRTTYTMRSADDGDVTVPLIVVCRYAAGRRDRHGRDYLPFAVVGRGGDALRLRQVAAEYRDRFGIESSYRQMNAVRAPTTSRDPALRRLLVVVALLLTNLWVWLKVALLAATPPATRPRARRWLTTAFRLDRFCDLLIEAIKTRYHTHTALAYPFPTAAQLEL
ncbi:MAG TPA: transposase [Thermomicrobiales bacterium]|nr:transposase [Thermomicrobiales bacterium]